MKIITTAMLLSLALPLLSQRASAQQTQTQIAVSGGVATDQRGVHSSAITVAPTLTLQPSAGVSMQLGGNATRFSTEVWSLGASAALSGRNPLGRFAALTLGANGSASTFASGASGTFVLGDVVPAVEILAGPVTLFGGVRATAGRSTQPGIVAAPPPIFGGPRDAPSIVETATAAGPLFGAALRLNGSAGTMQVGAREDRLHVANETLIDRSISLVAAHDRMTVGASIGRRSAPGENVIFASVSTSLRLTSDVSLDVAAGRYPRNPVLNTPAGRYASAGLSLHFGAADRAPELPRPSGVRSPRAGKTRLSIHASDARRVEVAGDFTEWKFVAASRAANGVWYADLTIPPGQYRYAFRINGTEWRVPDGATAVDDGFGGKSAWITVPGRRTSR